MRSRTETRIQMLVVLLTLALILVSCSSGPPLPARGTPEWHWHSAAQTYAIKDYRTAADHLESLAKTDSEYADRAQPWRMVITGGMATGYADAADSFEKGSAVLQAQVTVLRRQTNEYRNLANKQALQFAQTFLAFQKGPKEGNIPIAFGSPGGSLNVSTELTKASMGAVLSEMDLAAAEKQALERGVLLTACSVVGAQGDAAKAEQIFSGENVSVSRETFLLAIADKLNELSDLYSRKKLNQPERVQLFKEKALEALQEVPETDDTKKLIAALEEDLGR